MNQLHNQPPLNSSKTPSSTVAPDSPPPHIITNRKDTVRERSEVESHDPTVARKVQKADREKIRRDRLNDQFHELGNALDPDRPRNDKATIISETIQVLKDITAEVDRLKTEHKALSEESRELVQEKNELREEKASLKSDIQNLNSQYQQRVRVMPPWTAMDASVVMSSPYPYPVPMPIPPPVSIHPHMQPFPYFGNQNPGHVPSMCSMYIPFSAPANPPIEMPSTQYASTSHVLNRKELRNKSPGHRRPNDAKRCSVSPDVATELELKMPGSSTQQVDYKDSMSGGRKGKHSVMSDRIIIDESASSQYSPSQGPQDSFDSVGHTPKVVD
ncbi:hypothetical protein RYX36_021852 [Vicia faba]